MSTHPAIHAVQVNGIDGLSDAVTIADIEVADQVTISVVADTGKGLVDLHLEGAMGRMTPNEAFRVCAALMAAATAVEDGIPNF
jgi:hypothetical protein